VTDRREHHDQFVSDPTGFMQRGACLGSDPSVFVPENARGPHAYDEARVICARCAVQGQCLEYALLDPELPGMWGGKTGREREDIRRSRRRSYVGRSAAVRAITASGGELHH
jgi:WhiB family redox-sensing transcriptional regulator